MPEVRTWDSPHSRILAALATVILLGACQVSEETQALMDEFNRTVPVCTGMADCEAKWQAAYEWVQFLFCLHAKD